MDQGVEEVPDEEDAEFGRCGAVEDAERSSVCCDEDREGSKEGKYGCTINDQGGGGLHLHDLLVCWGFGSFEGHLFNLSTLVPVCPFPC